MEKKKIFLPFTIDKRFWNTNMTNVFLNKAYEAQIDEGEKRFPYTTLCMAYSDSKRIHGFWLNLTHALGEMLNRYHKLDESPEFWEKMLSSWVRDYVYSIWFKIEQFKNLMSQYVSGVHSFHTYAFHKWEEYDLLSFDDQYNGFIFHEQYHFISYLWLATRFYHIHVKELSFDLTTESAAIQGSDTDALQSMMRYFKDFVRVRIGDLTEALCSLRMEVGLFEEQRTRTSWVKWLFWSKGKICQMQLPQITSSDEVDTLFRTSMAETLAEELRADEEERMILDFLPKVLPKFFVENFMASYRVAEEYLSHHPQLSIIFTSTSSLKHNIEKIVMVLLQKRGGKILGQQHGGLYQVTDVFGYMLERKMNDYFYVWGKDGCLDFEYPSCKIAYAPCYKLAVYDTYKGREANSCSEKILYTGTAVRPYPRAFSLMYSCEKKIDEQNAEYISRKMRFLSSLTNDAQAKLLVRDYPIDYGWHVTKKLQTAFPNLWISTKGGFEECLMNCLLYVVDHLSTTWAEALYLNKPMIIFLSKENYPFYRVLPDEQPYFDLLKEAGILFYSPEAAAEQVNRILSEGVMEWWMDERRQDVVRQLRNRWTPKMDDMKDIDEWWFAELLRQAEEVTRSF